MGKIFLGGTCNGSLWRDQLIPLLDQRVSYFNPIVKDWTPKCQEIEEFEKENSTFNVYVITPKMTGVFSIAELVHDSIKQSKKTVFCFLQTDEDREFDKAQIKSLAAVRKMCEKEGARYCQSLKELAEYINSKWDNYEK